MLITGATQEQVRGRAVPLQRPALQFTGISRHPLVFGKEFLLGVAVFKGWAEEQYQNRLELDPIALSPVSLSCSVPCSGYDDGLFSDVVLCITCLFLNLFSTVHL